MREIGVGSGHISGMSDPRGGSDSDRDSLTGWTLVDREGTPEPHDPQQDEKPTVLLNSYKKAGLIKRHNSYSKSLSKLRRLMGEEEGAGIAGGGAVEDLEEEEEDEDEDEEEEDESGCGMEEDEGEEDLPEDLVHMGQHVQEVKEEHTKGSSKKPLNQNDSPAEAGKSTEDITKLVEDKESSVMSSQHDETPLKIEKLAQKLGDLTITEELASAEMSEKSLNDNKEVIENVVIKQSPSFEIPEASGSNNLNLGAKPKTNNAKNSMKTKTDQKIIDVLKEEEIKRCPLKSDTDIPGQTEKVKVLEDRTVKHSIIDETLKENSESIVDDSYFKSTNDSSEKVNVNIILKDEAVAQEVNKEDSEEIGVTLKEAVEEKYELTAIDNQNPTHELKASPSEIPINELVEAMREEVPLEEPLIEDVLNVETQSEEAISEDQSKEASKILPEKGDILEITSPVSLSLLIAKTALKSELPTDMTSRKPPTQQTQMEVETSSDTQEIPLGIGTPSDTSKEIDLQVSSLDTIIQPDVFTKEVVTNVSPIEVKVPSNVSLIEPSTQESPLEVKELLDAPPIESLIQKSDFEIPVETMKKNEIIEANENELTVQDENDKSNKSEIEVDYQNVDKIPSDSPTLTDVPGSLLEPAGDADVESLASTTDISVLDDDKDMKDSAAMMGLKDDETDLSLASSPSLPEDLPAIKKISRKERKLELARGENEPSSPSVLARLMEPFLPSSFSRSQVLNVWPLSILRQKEGEEGEVEEEKVEEEAISNETASFSGAWLYDRALQSCTTLEQSYSVVEDKFNALNPWGPDRQYQHTPSSKFNGRLNTIVMLTIATVCGLAIGHFLGFLFPMSGASSTGTSE